MTIDLDRDDRLIIEMASPDPTVCQALTAINRLTLLDPLRHECEGMLYMQLARIAFREAERLHRVDTVAG